MSVKAQLAAYAFGVPYDINAFHYYTVRSANLYLTLELQYYTLYHGWAVIFNI